ncbi:hypothetical protein [Methylorubrum thiocyanatum]|uniref:DNA binding CopG/RHH family protein n=1 Tax=Methylorubrum thiocyanatum TaxID=47958 RepID=A0AA40VDJ1_9HYPH|nr:hypothetical protein [Methylorubrum thiocyanatum]MBA8916002.1 putative DNA binding CopG/RHH family protein [Methylorubrum thiocyanatum]GJE80913.1 hypothetical protein CJNNKLLH_2254 [Methylorubrum thiocyanatum]
MHQISLRMPVSLFRELARQAAERGLPVAAYVRSQLAHSIKSPVNIHKTNKETNVSTEVV